MKIFPELISSEEEILDIGGNIPKHLKLPWGSLLHQANKSMTLLVASQQETSSSRHKTCTRQEDQQMGPNQALCHPLSNS
ncbi:hypothetical protein GDO81_014094 [Engystomops pustulosus]|uniref:Uncharacterized protein n=1 Tax=Engystomops pustulosus TaxID=76066 RepID=A0AAV7B8D2_ENGPU|nr:hypothetical protein GDO81_014094 [Engystomops pustulosus]